ncbi:YD repeat-containing protein [Flavobacterium aquicola]|uniref:YD repeat-containing protein n=2 Tax=Flavobacterium aquicola TaxID=1682742 RepID=A0A3E0E409_9FLAO|nr:YD repeat-containing protein [Flavobacterium aquicola]
MVFSSCSKDETSEIQPETQPEAHQNLLLKITDSDGLTSTYSYDSNNRLDNYKRNGNDFNPDLNQNLVYNADGTLQKLVQADNGAIVTEFFYDANKKIIKKIGRSGFDTFKYSYSGNVITEDYRSATTDVGWRQTYTYDENGNIIELKSYNDATDANPEGTFSAVINYTYDDKKNAASSFPQGFLFPSSANNIKTAQYNGGGIGSSQYEYNLDGYPTKRTDSFTRVYEYKRL